jgi:glycosyltransferase involved in cell wall biosynthesis
VVGTINERLDFELLNRCASSEQVGAILFVGPVKNVHDEHLRMLQHHPKCVFTGEQPHGALPSWMHFVDIALIPYKEDPFNYFCSPMRLFDHLAAGKPVIATEACDQIRDFAHVVASGSGDVFVARVEEAIRDGMRDIAAADRRIRVARDNTWWERARAFEQLLNLL